MENSIQKRVLFTGILLLVAFFLFSDCYAKNKSTKIISAQNGAPKAKKLSNFDLIIKGSVIQKEASDKSLEENVVEEHLDKAEAFMEQDDPNSALRVCALVYVKAPSNPRLNAYIAWILLKQNNPLEAKKFIQTALTNEKNEASKPFYWLMLAVTNFSLGQKKEAKSVLDRAIEKLSPTSEKYAQILWSGGQLYDDLGFSLEAYNLLKIYFQMTPPSEDPGAFEIYTKLSISESPESEQIKIIQSYVNLPEEDTSAAQKRRKVLGWYFASKNCDYSKVAELAYQNLLIAPPEWLDISGHEAIHEKLEDKTIFLNRLNVLIQKYPEILTFRIQLAEAYEKAGEIKKARMAYETILSKDPRHHYALKGLGELEYENGDFKKAIRYLNKATKTRPTGESESPFSFCILAKAYEGNFDPNMALLTWEKVKTIAHSILYAENRSFMDILSAKVYGDLFRDTIIEAEERIEMLKLYRPISAELKETINQIFQTLAKYDSANDKLIDGFKNTTPNYDQYGGFITYNVSSDIYLAEQLYRDCSAMASLIDEIPKIIKIRNLIIEGANQAASAVELSSKGYYISLKDYSGQFEKGTALRRVANQKIADVCELLLLLEKKHCPDFQSEIEWIQNTIEYYKIKD